jgi:hypothetical protein
MMNLSVSALRTEDRNGNRLNTKRTRPQNRREAVTNERNAENCSYILEYRDMGKARAEQKQHETHEVRCSY